MPITKKTVGTGMLTREVTSYSPETDEEIAEAVAALIAIKTHGQIRDENAVRLRGYLQDKGFSPYDSDELKHKFGADSFYVAAAEWIRVYDQLSMHRKRSMRDDKDASVIEEMIDCAEILGKLQERIFWRHGVDPETRARREKLAIQGRGTRKGLPQGQEKLANTNRQRSRVSERWTEVAQAMAEEIWSRNPELSLINVAILISRSKKWPDGVKRRTNHNTIRRKIKKPVTART